MSELGYLFHDKSSMHIVACDLDVERSQLWYIVLDDVKSYNKIKGFVNYNIYTLTTVKAGVLNKPYIYY